MIPTLKAWARRIAALEGLLAAALVACKGPAPRAVARATRPAPVNVYADARAGMLSATAASARPAVYVPLGGEASVAVIDPRSYRVVRRFETGVLPQHVVPSYTMATLWVANDRGNSLTPIDAVTGEVGPNIAVTDPYNLYFTPDGRSAIVVAERRRRLDFRDPHTMALRDTVHTGCRGVDHMDFTRDGRFAVVSCEFSGQLLRVDVNARRIVDSLTLPHDSLGRIAAPQDVRLSPDGRRFYVADMMADGVHLVDADSLQLVGFIATGKGAHGVYPSRDGRLFYVSNRGANAVMGPPHGPGSVSVIDPAARRVVATWPVPGGGSPDMGDVSADGKELWLSGRFDGEVYVFDTATGLLTHRIPVGRDPHGLCVWPQPGRFSLGHTGNMR